MTRVPHGKPTLVSLARQLGVSRQTVSNVINCPHVVSPETRRRVQRAIDESGYRPSHVARTLRTRRSMTLGLRLRPATGDGFNRTIMDLFFHRLVVEAQRAGYRLAVFDTPDDEAEARELRAMAEDSLIDASVITDTDVDDPRPALLAGSPFVSFGRPWADNAPPHAWVDVDGAAGTAAATQALIDRGYRRIGFLGWDATSGAGNDRLAGWRSTLSDAGLPAHLSTSTDDAVAAGTEAAATLLEQGADALVCASDALAFGALERVRGSDSGVPVIGFDDTPIARATGLSSVHQPIEEVAAAVVAALVTLLDEGSVTQKLLVPELILRNVEVRR